MTYSKMYINAQHRCRPSATATESFRELAIWVLMPA